jgi:hypothetical protein
MASVLLCEACDQELQPDDRVIAAAEQVDASSQGDTTRQWIDGPRALFHERHWLGDSAPWRELDSGALSSLI